MKQLLRIFLLSILYFLFIFTFQIPGLPRGVLSYRCVVVLLFVITFLYRTKFTKFNTYQTDRIVKSYVKWNMFLTVYVIIILFLFGHGSLSSHESTNDYVNMALVLPLFYYSGKRIFRDLDDIMLVLCLVGLIQSAIIIAGTISPGVNTLLTVINSDSAFAENDRMGEMMASGYHLGFKCFTSLGSLQLALSQIAASYFIEKKGNIVAVISLIIISMASCLLARIGLFIAVVCIIFILLGKNNKSKRRVLIVTLVILVALFILVTNSAFSISEFVDVNFNRFKVLFENGIYDSYLKGYAGDGSSDSNKIPPISLYTLIGTGITNGISGTGIKVACDGAFMRNYAAMGLIVTCINYALLYSYYRKLRNISNVKLHRSLIMLLGIVLMIGEFKEYFTYQIYYMCFAMVIICLIEKENKSSL